MKAIFWIIVIIEFISFFIEMQEFYIFLVTNETKTSKRFFAGVMWVVEKHNPGFFLSSMFIPNTIINLDFISVASIYKTDYNLNLRQPLILMKRRSSP